MARGSGGALKKARLKSISILAWATLGVALVGGTFAAGMWIGGVVRTVLGVLPWEWVPGVLLLVAVVGMIIDLLVDGAPNQVAVAGLALTPSIATAADGKLSYKIGEWTGALVSWMNSELTEWLGTDSGIGLAIACIVCAFLMSRRVVKKQRGGTAASTPAGV